MTDYLVTGIVQKNEPLKMKKVLLILLILTTSLFLTGCWVYGEGKTYGYITTVENGIFWDKVWLRAELESSQTDCYAIDKSTQQSSLQEDLRQSSINKDRIEITFKRHIFININADCNSDEVINFRTI